MKKYFTLPEKVKYLSEFKGKRVAIDAHNYMYKQIYGAQKRTLASTDVALFGADRPETLKTWIGMILRLIMDFIELGVTPVTVFDGPSVKEKSGTKKKRRDKNTDKIERIEEIEKEIRTYDPVSVPQKLTDELRKLYSEVVYVSYEEQEYLRNILTSIGVPVIQAKSEAEKLCSMMCIEGIVSAVYSTDTDNFALGCPIVIKKIDRKVFSKTTGSFDRQLTTVALADILSLLKFTFSTFVDLCIMGGNDFNQNIEGIGLRNAHKLLEKCGSIENLPKGLDTDVLNYKRSREIFSTEPWTECCLLDKDSTCFNLPEDGLPSMARDVLESIGKESLLVQLVDSIKNCPKAKDRGWTIPPHQKRLTLGKKVSTGEEK